MKSILIPEGGSSLIMGMDENDGYVKSLEGDHTGRGGRKQQLSGGMDYSGFNDFFWESSTEFYLRLVFAGEGAAASLPDVG